MHNREYLIEDRSELRSLLSEGKYTTLALTDGNDPYILTLSYGLDELEDTLYFHSSLDGTKLDFFKSNPYLCGTVIIDDGYQQGKFDHYYRSVVYYGLLEVIHKEDEKIKAISCLFRQLENNSEEHIKRITSEPESLRNIMILKLNIDEMKGKRNPA